MDTRSVQKNYFWNDETSPSHRARFTQKAWALLLYDIQKRYAIEQIFISSGLEDLRVLLNLLIPGKKAIVLLSFESNNISLYFYPNERGLKVYLFRPDGIKAEEPDVKSLIALLHSTYYEHNFAIYLSAPRIAEANTDEYTLAALHFFAKKGRALFKNPTKMSKKSNCYELEKLPEELETFLAKRRTTDILQTALTALEAIDQEFKNLKPLIERMQGIELFNKQLKYHPGFRLDFIAKKLTITFNDENELKIDEFFTRFNFALTLSNHALPLIHINKTEKPFCIIIQWSVEKNFEKYISTLWLDLPKFSEKHLPQTLAMQGFTSHVLLQIAYRKMLCSSNFVTDDPQIIAQLKLSIEHYISRQENQLIASLNVLALILQNKPKPLLELLNVSPNINHPNWKNIFAKLCYYVTIELMAHLNQLEAKNISHNFNLLLYAKLIPSMHKLFELFNPTETEDFLLDLAEIQQLHHFRQIIKCIPLKHQCSIADLIFKNDIRQKDTSRNKTKLLFEIAWMMHEDARFDFIFLNKSKIFATLENFQMALQLLPEASRLNWLKQFSHFEWINIPNALLTQITESLPITERHIFLNQLEYELVDIHLFLPLLPREERYAFIRNCLDKNEHINSLKISMAKHFLAIAKCLAPIHCAEIMASLMKIIDKEVLLATFKTFPQGTMSIYLSAEQKTIHYPTLCIILRELPVNDRYQLLDLFPDNCMPAFQDFISPQADLLEIELILQYLKKNPELLSLENIKIITQLLPIDKQPIFSQYALKKLANPARFFQLSTDESNTETLDANPFYLGK